MTYFSDHLGNTIVSFHSPVALTKSNNSFFIQRMNLYFYALFLLRLILDFLSSLDLVTDGTSEKMRNRMNDCLPWMN